MGLSGSKQTTTQTYTPSAQQINAGNTLQNAFTTQMPKITGYADQLGSLIPSLMQKYQAGDPGINAAQGWITSTLGNTGGNPMLEQIIAQNGANTAGALKSQMGTRGITGGTAYNGILAKALAEQDANLRYQDYNNQNALKAQAAGMAPSMAAGNMASIVPLLSITQAAGGMPLDAASQYASGMGSLFNNSGTSTTTQQSSGGLLGGLLGSALSGWASGGFKR